MIELNYLIPAIVFFGYIAGLIIGKLTKDEFKSGKKWFILLQKTLLLLLAIGSLYYVKLSWMLIIGILIGFFTLKYLKVYFYFGLLSFLSLSFKDYDIIINSLMFLFGLPYAAMKKDYFVFLFFIPFTLLLFNSLNFDLNLNLFFGVCCGAFIRQYYLAN